MQPLDPTTGTTSPVTGKPTGKRGCAKRKRGGMLCDGPAITGTDRCRMHAGQPAAKLKAQGEVRTMVINWGLGDSAVDPGEVLLRLVTQSAVRAERYAAELGQMVEDSDSLQKALIEEAWGEFGKQGEFVRGLVKLEAEERDRCAAMATKAIAAGLAERQVRIAERQGAQVVQLLKAFAQALGHDPADPTVVEAMTRELRAIQAA